MLHGIIHLPQTPNSKATPIMNYSLIIRNFMVFTIFLVLNKKLFVY